MRIAVWYNVPSGGAKRALYDHITGLLALGHTVEVWCPPTADRTYLPLSAIVVEHVVDLAWPVPFSRLDELMVTMEADRAVEAMREHCQACANQIDQGGFDVLFAASCMLFAVSPIGSLSKTPSVLYLQEPYRRLYEANPRLPWLAGPRAPGSRWSVRSLRSSFADLRRIRNMQILAREETANAAAFDRILVNSYFSRESLLRSYGLGSTVCYLGIDTGHFENRHLPREDFVVGLGSLSPLKNVRLVIEALGAVAAPRPKLIWIGNMSSPDYVDAMHTLARSLDVMFEARVRVSDAELVDLLNRAAMMVYAPRLEPFGLAPLEAGACGVPVVAVAEGGVRETVIDGVTGLQVPHDARAMAAAITRLRDDPALARLLGEAACVEVKTRWSSDAATQRIVHELELFAHAA